MKRPPLVLALVALLAVPIAAQTPAAIAAQIKALAIALELALAPAPSPSITSLHAGGNLQAALEAAVPGDTIELEVGASFVGNFVLPATPAGEGWITLRSASAKNQPAPGDRAWETDTVAVLRTPNTQPALATAPGAHHWRLELFRVSPTVAGVGDLVTLGDGSSAQQSLAGVPHDLVLDRVSIDIPEGLAVKRGLALNSASTTIINSRIAGAKVIDQDSQAIMMWNGPGPYVITNNYLEGAGENVMVGGSDPSIPNLIPSDLTFRGNHVARPMTWKGGPWQVKNLFELKNARRVVVEGNLFENHWAQAQAGPAIVFTVRNQDGGCSWCAVEDVRFEHNIVRNVDAGLSITGLDDEGRVSGGTRGIVVRNNLWEAVKGHWAQLLNGPIVGLVLERNTARQGGNILTMDGAPSPGAIIRFNATAHGSWGVIGNNQAVGRGSLNAFLPGVIFSGNAIVGAPGYLQGSVYPAGNVFPATWAGVPSTSGVDLAQLPDVAKIIAGR
jgi:hypothetical protein